MLSKNMYIYIYISVYHCKMSNFTSKIHGGIIHEKFEFHTNRFLKVKPLEDDTFDIQMIDSTRKILRSGSLQVNVKSIDNVYHSSLFHAVLCEPNDYEAIGKKLKETKEKFEFNGNKVSVSLSETEDVLCVAHLPQSFSETEFNKLLKLHGKINWSFMMLNKYTKKFGHYGFVNYSNNESAIRAKNFFHNKNLNSSLLYCDWINGKLCTYDDLYSSCVFIENIPLNYRDFEDFRTIFSKVVKPRYCQIIMNRTQTTGYGIAEFHSVEEACETYLALKNTTIHGQAIKVTFCMPGVKAADVVNKLDFNPGLLHDPPAEFKALKEIQLLCYENPQENGRHLKSLHETMMKHVAFKDPSTSELETVKHNVTTDSSIATPLTMQQHFHSRAKPSLPGYTENVPSANFNNTALEILGATISQQNAMAKMPQYPSHTMISEPDRFFPAQNQNVANIGLYSTPVALVMNSQMSPPASMTYCIGSQVKYNSPNLYPHVLRAPVYERISPIGGGLRSTPYSRQTRTENCNKRYKRSRINAEPSRFPLVLTPKTSHKPPEFMVNRQNRALQNPNEVHYIDYNQKIWDYPQQTPLKTWQYIETTEVGNKRVHVLPSPEMSPDIPVTYIGQHSQGIGGHYEDSYFSENMSF
ncbi:Ribonucleoprotein PTB-binding 2 [Nymphon striatum]|nr:Ribonucleoprotein PTB-binding 2 [Nymphon striatum]